MSGFIANARMYAVSPAAEAAWRDLLARIFEAAEVSFDYLPYPAPKPLEDLWSRPDLGCVMMCGYPMVLGLADIRPIAAPIPSLDWAGGKPLYRSHLIMRADAPFHSLEDSFGHRAGWTVEHSHSGFNAFRHHLLRFRSAERPTLYASMTGHLITARRILDSVRSGLIDVGPLDGYWHALIEQHQPDLAAGVRILDVTALAPIPAFVAAPALPEEAVLRLKQSFADAANRPWFDAFRTPLLLSGFAPVTIDDFAITLERDSEAKAAGYPFPA
jgi:ABC-type phosphate/phosphonate transport system substrate-binding protein